MIKDKQPKKLGVESHDRGTLVNQHHTARRTDSHNRDARTCFAWLSLFCVKRSHFHRPLDMVAVVLLFRNRTRCPVVLSFILTKGVGCI